MYEDEVTISATANAGYSINRFVLTIDENTTSALADNKLSMIEDNFALDSEGRSRDLVVVNVTTINNTDTDYAVEVYVTGLDGEYVLRHTINKQGETDALLVEGVADAQAKEISVMDIIADEVANERLDLVGFTFTSSTVSGGGLEIAGDGSTVVKVYYVRNNYSLEIETDNANAFKTMDGANGSIAYEEEVVVTLTLNLGYLLDKDADITLENEEGEDMGTAIASREESVDDETQQKTIVITIKMPADNVVLVLDPKADTETNYDIVIWKQSIDLFDEEDGNKAKYDQVTVIKAKGTTESEITLDMIETELAKQTLDLTGFNPEYVTDVEGKRVAGDGSTKINVWFDRVTMKLSPNAQRDLGRWNRC